MTHKCGGCKKQVTKTDKGLKCEYCGGWYHIECESVTSEAYDFIENHGEQLHWFCKGCNSKAIEVLKLVQGLKDQQDKLEEKVNELTTRVEEIDNIKGSHKERVCNVVREELYEIREREAKSANVIIRNLEEIEEGGRWNDDKELVEHLVHNVLGQKDVEVVSTGRVPENRIDGRNRLVVVTLGTRTMKVKVLRVAKSLRSNDQWKQVYINADETKREREKQYQLRKELRDRRENGETNLVIHRGQVVEADGKKMQGTQMEQKKENDDGLHGRKHQEGSPPTRSRSTSDALKMGSQTPPLRRNSQPKMTTTRRGSQSTKPAKK